MTISAIEDQLLRLQSERQAYVRRMMELLGREGQELEVRGYLRMIEAVNDAAIQFARQSTQAMSRI